MDVVFDPAKDAENLRKHGYSLAEAADFDFNQALVVADNSQDYGEERWILFGFLGTDLCTLVCVFLSETAIRAISLRDATKAERNRYAEEVS